jgi:hypothetical protein
VTMLGAGSQMSGEKDPEVLEKIVAALLAE